MANNAVGGDSNWTSNSSNGVGDSNRARDSNRVGDSMANNRSNIRVFSFCNQCQVNINTIAKVETMDEDTEYILQKIKVSKGRIDMSKKNQAPDGKSASDVANGFLKSIGSSLYAKILKLYIVDFDIFGYVPKVFSEL